MVITLSFYKCHFRIWRFKSLISATLSFGHLFGSFSSWKVFNQNVNLDWGRWIIFFDLFFSVFLFLCGAFLCLYFSISYFIFFILNLECKVGSTHLSSLWNWRHFSAWISGMRTWAKNVYNPKPLNILFNCNITRKNAEVSKYLVGLEKLTADNLKIRIFLDIPSTLVTANRPRPQIGANLENNIYKLNQK